MPPRGSPPTAERHLRFTLEGTAYALPLTHVDGLASCGVIRPVPGAAPAVLGLTEWRGTLLTVLDLPRLLGRRPAACEPCLIRLAPPLHGVALHLPAPVRVDPAEAETPGTACQRIDVLRLLQRIEAATGKNE